MTSAAPQLRESSMNLTCLILFYFWSTKAYHCHQLLGWLVSQVYAVNIEVPTNPNEPHACYLMLNDGIDFLTSFLEKECRRLHEKATVLKVIKEKPQTLKAGKTKAVRTTLI